MNMTDENIDHLFSQARMQEPVASLDETKKAFITATVVAAGGMLATNGLLKLLTVKKWIIMLSTVAIITTGTLIVSLSPKPTEVTENLEPNNHEHVTALTEDLNEEKDPILDASSYVEPDIPTEIAAVDPSNIFELIEDEPDFLEEHDFIVEEDASGIEFKTTYIQADAPQLNPSAGKIKSYSERFVITENTTEADFEKMKSDAEKDGIDFFYKAKYDKDKLSKLRLELRIESEDDGESQYVMTSLTIQGEFSYTVAWDNSEEGGATHIYCGHTDDFDEGVNNIQGYYEDAGLEFEDMLAEMEFDDLFTSLDSLADQMANSFEFQWGDMAEEMAEMEKELAKAMQEFDQIEIQEMMKELSSSSEEMVKELQEEMKNMQEELEEQRKELEQQREELEKEKEMEDEKNGEEKEEEKEDEGKDEKGKKDKGTRV